VVICLEQGADLHMAQLMPLPLTVSCFSKIQIGFTFLVPAHPGSPGQRTVKRVCACVCVLLKSDGLNRWLHLVPDEAMTSQHAGEAGYDSYLRDAQQQVYSRSLA